MEIDISADEWLIFKEQATDVLGSLHMSAETTHKVIDRYFDYVILNVIPKYGQSQDGELASYLNERRTELSSITDYPDYDLQSLKSRYTEPQNEIYDILKFIQIGEEYLGQSDAQITIRLDDRKIVTGQQGSKEDTGKPAVEIFKELFRSIIKTFDITPDTQHSVLQKWIDLVVVPAHKEGKITVEQRDAAIEVCEKLDEEVFDAEELNCSYDELYRRYGNYNLDDLLYNTRGLVNCLYQILPTLEQTYKFRYGDIVHTVKILPDVNIAGMICGIVDPVFTRKKVYIVHPFRFVGDSECYTVEEKDLEPLTVDMGQRVSLDKRTH